MEKKIRDIENKIPEVSGLVTTTILKLGEVENNIPDTSGLVTAAVLNTKLGEVENKTPDVIGLVKKTNYNAKIFDTEKKYFTISDYNKFLRKIRDAKVQQANIATDSDLYIVSQGANKNKEKIGKLQTLSLTYSLSS